MPKERSNMLKSKKMILNVIACVSVSTVVVFFFNNCTRNEPTPEESLMPLEQEVDNAHQVAKVQNLQGETLDIRQTLESYLSLLQLTRDDLGGDLTAVIAELSRRRTLLPQEPDSKTLDMVGILSQTSLAGEVCRVFVTKKGPTSPLFSGVDLTKNPKTSPTSNWINTFHRLALQAWGRSMSNDELTSVVNFVNESVQASAKSPNVNKTDSISGLNFNVESTNLGIMLCTAVLVAPEATSL